MPVVAYTDLFNEALDDLTAKLQSIIGLQVANDPRNIVQMTYPVRLITLGPGNLDAQRSLMNMAAKLLAANIAVTDGRPTIAVMGTGEYPAYDLTVEMQAQTG